MATDVFGFEERDARRIDETVSQVLGTRAATGSEIRPSDSQLPIVVTPAAAPPLELDWMTSEFEVTTHSIDGEDWLDDKSILEVRLITGGMQLGIPIAGVGLCVRDDAFWCVNVGTSAAPTISVSSGVISGMSSSGVAAVLDTQPDGKLKVTDKRLKYTRLDDGGAIEDGTLIQLAYVSGNLTCVFANCDPTTGLTGLEAEPE